MAAGFAPGSRCVAAVAKRIRNRMQRAIGEAHIKVSYAPGWGDEALDTSIPNHTQALGSSRSPPPRAHIWLPSAAETTANRGSGPGDGIGGLAVSSVKLGQIF